MFKLFSAVFIVAQCFAICASDADSCDEPKPLFGRVIAVCGNHMINYVGDEHFEVLGINSVKSRFELANCSNGGNRKELIFQSNSVGGTLL
jgi:hypothetical protein